MPILSVGLLTACLFSSGFAMTIGPSDPPDDKLQGILPLVGQHVTYSEVVDCGSVSQADLFRRARLWIAQTSASTRYAMSLSDKETGDLVSRGRLVVVLPRSENSTGGLFSFHYSLVVECANRKYRATITQIDLEEGPGDKLTPIETYAQRDEKDLKVIYAALDSQLRRVLATLQENVKNYRTF